MKNSFVKKKMDKEKSVKRRRISRTFAEPKGVGSGTAGPHTETPPESSDKGESEFKQVGAMLLGAMNTMMEAMMILTTFKF